MPVRSWVDTGVMRSVIPTPSSHTHPEKTVAGPRSGAPATVRTTSSESNVATANVSHPTRAGTRCDRRSSSPSAPRDDCSRDLVVDRLLLRVPQLPQPADGPDDEDGEADLEGPDEAAQGGFAHRRILPGRHVTHLQAEGHHSDRGAARAPEVREVRDVDHHAENAGQEDGRG